MLTGKVDIWTNLPGFLHFTNSPDIEQNWVNKSGWASSRIFFSMNSYHFYKFVYLDIFPVGKGKIVSILLNIHALTKTGSKF